MLEGWAVSLQLEVQRLHQGTQPHSIPSPIIIPAHPHRPSFPHCPAPGECLAGEFPSESGRGLSAQLPQDRRLSGLSQMWLLLLVPLSEELIWEGPSWSQGSKQLFLQGAEQVASWSGSPSAGVL